MTISRIPSSPPSYHITDLKNGAVKRYFSEDTPNILCPSVSGPKYIGPYE